MPADPQDGGPIILAGKDWPNLVLVLDSGLDRKPEFRVQCEVLLTEAEARTVSEQLWPQTNLRTVEGLNTVQNIVVARISTNATQVFRNIIDQGFADQPERK